MGLTGSDECLGRVECVLGRAGIQVIGQARHGVIACGQAQCGAAGDGTRKIGIERVIVAQLWVGIAHRLWFGAGLGEEGAQGGVESHGAAGPRSIIRHQCGQGQLLIHIAGADREHGGGRLGTENSLDGVIAALQSFVGKEGIIRFGHGGSIGVRPRHRHKAIELAQALEPAGGILFP